MERMTEAAALAAGLTTLIDTDGVPVVETPAETADRAARSADELAAMVEQMLRRGADRVSLAIVRDSLGAMHVEFDMLAEELRQGVAAHDTRGAA